MSQKNEKKKDLDQRRFAGSTEPVEIPAEIARFLRQLLIAVAGAVPAGGHGHYAILMGLLEEHTDEAQKIAFRDVVDARWLEKVDTRSEEAVAG